MTHVALFRAFLLGLFLTALLSGCIRPTTRPPDEKGFAELVDGIRSFESGRYADARNRFLKIIESYPGSPLLSEAQWLLARTYDAAGEKPAAIRELQFFLKNYPKSIHEEEAHFLLLRLEQTDQKTIAVIWSPLSGRSLEAYLQPFLGKANTVIIPAFSNAAGRSGVFFQTSSAPVLADRLPEWIEIAHQKGFRIVAAMPIREMQWATQSHPEWRDRQYQSNNGTFQPIEKLDLFNPDVKEMALQLYRALSQYPVDGIYVGDLSYRIEEGWTPSAVRLYDSLFSESVDPGSIVTGAISRAGGADARAPQFWHWVGWRSRFLSGFMKELQTDIRSRRPELQWGVVLSEAVLSQPVKGLSEMSIDLLDMRSAENNFYLIFTQSNPSGVSSLLEAISKYAIRPQEVWFQPTSTNRALLTEAMKSPIQGIILPSP